MTSPVLQGARILIVEDEFLLAEDLADRLNREGCEVIGPASRESNALSILERDRPDAVVLDLNLAGKLPIDLARSLFTRQIPFVIVTGYSERELDIPELQEATRLQKPVKTEELVRTLRHLVRAAN
jgi:two-component SAPR family response regulator